MNHSKTQIVVTTGPSTSTPDVMHDLIKNGMDVARLNFSHRTFREHRDEIENIKMCSSHYRRNIPIIGDLSGPREQGEDTHGYDIGALTPITQKDLEAIEFSVEQEVDYLALSYVGCEEDILELRRLLGKVGSDIKIIAKIERKEALRNLPGIVDASDAIMIARGDLGNEVPIEQIPYIQYEIITYTNWVHKPVITATEMLTSMVEEPEPTRAEVSDVAYAVISGSDAVMLSEETAIGKYPVEAVNIMDKIVTEAERHTPYICTHPL